MATPETPIIPLVPPAPRRVRQDQWERRLVAWAESLDGAPYELGRTDCLALADQALTVVTGCGLVLPPLESRVTPLGAARCVMDAIDAHGSMAEALVAQGLTIAPPIPRFHGGDLLVWEPGTELQAGAESEPLTLPLVAIVVARHVLWPSHDRGVELVPMAAVRTMALAATVLRV